MDSNNKDNSTNLQDQHAKILNDTYRLGWMDGYANGYDDCVEDTESKINMLENTTELMQELLDEKDELINELASNAGKSLQAIKKR